MLDDLPLGEMPGLEAQLAVVAHAVTAVGGVLVATTRNATPLLGIEHAQYLDASALRLTYEEARSMFDTASSGGQSIEVLEEAWRASGGHAAFFAVLLTSGGAGASGTFAQRRSLDLDGLLNRVISAHLLDEDLKTLTAMAMLGSGTNEQLQSIGVEPALVPSISRVLPLVTITEAPELGFRVHDILRRASV